MGGLVLQRINSIETTRKYNKSSGLDRLNSLHRRYDGPVPKPLHPRTQIPREIAAEKWLCFWRGQVLHAVYALRRQRAQRYGQHSRDQLQRWRGGVISRQRALTRALRAYRHLQQQKAGRGDRAGR